MLNLQNIFSSKYYNIIIVLFLVITFTITLYNLLKHINNDKYVSYSKIGEPVYYQIKELRKLTNEQFNNIINTLHPNTTSIRIDIDVQSMSNSSKGSLIIINEDTNSPVDKNDTTKFGLDFIIYGSNSKDRTTFTPKYKQQFITSLYTILNGSNNVNNYLLTVNNINFKYYYIVVDLKNLDKNKNYRINAIQPNATVTTITFKK